MFESIRHKFHSVQENLTASLRGLSTTDSAKRTSVHGINPDINFHAGTQILERFQASWSELHEAAQENAAKAQEADQLIGRLHKRAEKQWRDIGQIGTVLSRLPEIINSVNELSERILLVGGLFDTVEKALMQLEDLAEIRELQDRQLDHRFQLALYKEKKLSMLENVRVTLAEEHAEKVRRHELRLQRIQKERQEAFENQFKQDLQIYKETSTIPIIPKTKVETDLKPEENTLEEVVLDSEDVNALDDFLCDNAEDSR